MIRIEVAVKVNGREITSPKLNQVVEWWVTQQLSNVTEEKKKEKKVPKAKKLPYQEWSKEEEEEFLSKILEYMDGDRKKFRKAVMEFSKSHTSRKFGALYTYARKFKRDGRI